jgi:ribonuclease BN (tRNA processing enzyme)
MAGELAKKTNAKVLLLNHISNIYSREEDVSQLMEIAKTANGGVSRILVAFDFMEMTIPRDGLIL